MTTSNKFHNDSLQKFSELLYKNIITINNKTSKKKAIKIDNNKYYGYFFEHRGESYFVEDLGGEDESLLDILPIMVNNKVEADFSNDVFWFVKDYDSVKIPSEKKMDAKVLIDTLSGFKHTNPAHLTLYKIICWTSITNRINCRVIAEKGFGKDSVINNINDLLGGIANIYGATMPKLEFSLNNKYIVLNEMGNLKDDDKYNFQQFFLAVGGFSNSYTKRTRKSEGTHEVFNIGKISLTVLYNPPNYYTERGQEFFDTMFTQAVQNRFIPFYFEGTLNESFNADFDVGKVVEENMQQYKDMISTFLYYKNHSPVNKYIIPDDITFDEKTRRYERSFLKICDYISEYSRDEKEYYELLYALYGCYKKYGSVLQTALQEPTK